MKKKTKDYEVLFDKKTIGFTLGIILLVIATIFGLLRMRFVAILGLNNAGELGDSIGGIAGPIINLLGAVLVYKSFLTQIKANKIQFENIQKDRSFTSLWELYKEIKNDIDNFEYLYISNNTNSIVLRGLHSFERLVIELKSSYRTVIDRRKFVLKNISSIIQSMTLVYEKIELTDLDENDKVLILNKMDFLFSTRLISYLDDIIDAIKDEDSDIKDELSKYYDSLKTKIK